MKNIASHTDGGTELLMRYLNGFERQDLSMVMSCFDESSVLLLPYAPAGIKLEYRGVSELQAILDATMKLMMRMKFLDIELYASTSGTTFAVGRSEATFKDGRPYENRYCWLLKPENGIAKELREYFDPVKVADAFSIPR